MVGEYKHHCLESLCLVFSDTPNSGKPLGYECRGCTGDFILTNQNKITIEYV